MNIAAMFKMIIAMALFGSIGFFTVNTGIPAEELVFVRCICATLFLGGIWFFTGGHKTEQWSRKEIIQTLICGVFLVLNWVFLFKAFQDMSISVAITIYNLAPIFVLIMGSLFLKEKMTVQATLAVIVCFLGSIFIIGLDQFTSFKALFTSGFVWAMLSAICYALTMFVGKGITHLSAYAMTFVQTAVGIVILLPFMDYGVFEGLTTSNWMYILGTGLIHTGFVYYLFFDSLRKLPTIVVSALVFVDPVVAILLDVAILDFRPTLIQTAGIVLIFAGIIYTLVKPSKQISELSQV
ncbi:DMT family transporter [Viridibacillus sp. FSL R5-0477]|uniref:Transport protein n=1 Tax=Viridibacillus arenosi FSL R5-213 TaxID=1227360 RepID=W4ERW6_9BACL|nr:MULTISPECIES: DMT family transporter [Viridibacillus]ETT83004.1 transport protein [Viridibacillus arenosi FSL R5-213]OMC82055.1 EamA family transporter [Viridibacillus sp. FSL H8-0123]OMC90884.1 EamA family transporter [Viridibacillus arenosi]